MKSNVILFFLILFSLVSFKKSNDIDSDLLCKTWIFTKIESKPYPVYHYKLSDSIGDYPAYRFFKSGKLIVRQNLTTCPVGETKLKYATIIGSWKFKTDSVIQLKFKLNEKERVQRFRITLLNKEELVLSVKTK